MRKHLNKALKTLQVSNPRLNFTLKKQKAIHAPHIFYLYSDGVAVFSAATEYQMMDNINGLNNLLNRLTYE